jgi:hypothetical protein
MLTANNKHDLLQDIHGTSLLTWVLCIYNDEFSKDSIIKYGSFKFDTLAVMLMDLFVGEECVGLTNDLIIMTDVIHRSHVQNYLFWKEHRPWEQTNSMYSNPFLRRDKYEKYQHYQFSIDLPHKHRSKMAMLARKVMRQREIVLKITKT